MSDYIPYLSLELHIPTRPYDMAQKRVWNRIVRQAITKALEKHDRERIDKHFQPDAHSRYGYKDRKETYKRWKLRRYNRDQDLVKTGRSRKRMKHEKQIIIGGAAEGGKKGIQGRLRKKFDFTQTEQFKRSQKKRFVRRGKDWYDRSEGMRKAGVTIADMKREIQAFTQDERRAFAEDFFEECFRGYNEWKGQRQRIRTRSN